MKMARLVHCYDECLEDVHDAYKLEELRTIVKDYTGEITCYKKVKNGFLEAMYNLKKEEYISKYGASNVKERTLIHSTAANNVSGIIKDNFDWRRVVRSKYGVGVSFSDDADYANCHSNRSNGSARGFIITKVLMSRVGMGFQNLRIPSVDDDTTSGNHVYVKYRDNEFLPEYVLYYNCSSICTSSARAFIIAKVLIAQMHSGHQNLSTPYPDFDTTFGNHVYVKYRDNEFLPEYVLYYNCLSVRTSKYYGRRRHNIFFGSDIYELINQMQNL